MPGRFDENLNSYCCHGDSVDLCPMVGPPTWADGNHRTVAGCKSHEVAVAATAGSGIQIAEISEVAFPDITFEVVEQFEAEVGNLTGVAA